MRELGLVVVLLAVFFVAGAAQTLPWHALFDLGQAMMFRAAFVGIPAEIAYYAATGIALRYSRVAPPGWYWRSFEHHHLLTRGQRWAILPLFWLGAAAFVVVVLGILILVLSVAIAATR